tara:strand:- start:59 stop:529 length:471 start_codon:yes stop_codon:yes gene_type:complete
MPPVGWDPDGSRIEVELINRSGATTGKGEVVMLDIGGTDGDVTALGAVGGSDSPWANYIDPDVTVNTYGAAAIFAIALEEIANDAQGKCLLRGLSTYTKVDSSTAIATPLVPAADGELDVAGTSKLKIVGIALDADTSNYSTVYFDGINGMGLDHD